MKKIIYAIFSLGILLTLTGCKDTASMAVEKYLAKYNSLDSEVLTDMQNIIEKENISEENKKIYQNIFEKQYMDMTYKIVEEEYEGDEATVEVQLTVYDYYKVQKEANDYLVNHSDEFFDEAGKYDVNLFTKYKLEQMEKNIDTIDYTVEFYLVKSDKGWIVSELSKSDLEKIHGIYNYDE